MIFRNGETYRQRVNGGCHALHQQCTGFQVSIRMLRITAADSFEQHLSADEQEQHQRNPRDSTLERDKCLCNTSHAKPADYGHQKLKHCKSQRNHDPHAAGHLRCIQPIGHRHRKGIHRQTNTQQKAVDDKRNK